MLDDNEFALCLTHDVDRTHKKPIHCLYYWMKEHDFSHIKSLFTSENPYWQFEEIMKLEDKLGVRSSFYFLNEKKLFKDRKLLELVKPSKWKLYLGRYDIKSSQIVDVIKRLDKGGWEIGIQGSYESYKEPKRLKYEKDVLEQIVGHQIIGGRQHYLNLDNMMTWKYHQKIDLKYDTSLGSNSEYGFKYGYDIKYPFNNNFIIFPITIMDFVIMNNTTSKKQAWKECEKILREAKKNQAIITIDWHQRRLNSEEYPGYRELYEKIIRRSKEMGAWVGPPKKLYKSLSNSNSPIEETTVKR